MNSQSEVQENLRSPSSTSALKTQETMTDLQTQTTEDTQAGLENPTSTKKKKEPAKEAPVNKRKISLEKTPDTPRKKGRPSLNDGEKGKYRHLLLRESQIGSILRIKDQSILTKEQLNERRAIIMANKMANEYYWKLAYTYSFLMLKEKIKADVVLDKRTNQKQAKEISLKDVAEMANIPYHNFKKMFMGRGHMSNFETYTTFLYQNGIIFQDHYMDAGVIERAYAFYTIVSDESVNMALVEKMFY